MEQKCNRKVMGEELFSFTCNGFSKKPIELRIRVLDEYMRSNRIKHEPLCHSVFGWATLHDPVGRRLIRATAASGEDECVSHGSSRVHDEEIISCQ
ncbi:hypothetical protein QQF64_007017 [Cirrhinus molitorella]|uniref:Uncharacterized protein n=1 Tax=Cirrhinus molitorella TaxID=172907 RepID=A0ABR3M9I7_9TELE